MLRLIKLQIALILLVFSLAACVPAVIVSSSGVQPTPIVETEEVVQAATAKPIVTTIELPKLKVHDVQMQIGVGSPIPVDAFISGELPDTCAQLAEVRQALQNFSFEITVAVKPGTHEECLRDTLPFRIAVPLNMVNQPAGTYTVKVNGASTTFTWPSAPNVTPEPAAAANTSTYRNSSVGFEFDYPASWLLDNAGTVDMLWSGRPAGPGKGGVPDNVAKIDIIAELDKTMTLEELVARQKQDLAPEQIKSEQAIILPNGQRAVRLDVSAFADSRSLLTIVNGHPVLIANYGDASHFDEVVNTLRTTQL